MNRLAMIAESARAMSGMRPTSYNPPKSTKPTCYRVPSKKDQEARRAARRAAKSERRELLTLAQRGRAEAQHAKSITKRLAPEHRAEAIAQGYCADCLRVVVHGTGKLRCPGCLAHRVQTTLRAQAKRIAAGVCKLCTKTIATEAGSIDLCIDHLNSKRTYDVAYKQRGAA